MKKSSAYIYRINLSTLCLHNSSCHYWKRISIPNFGIYCSVELTGLKFKGLPLELGFFSYGQADLCFLIVASVYRNGTHANLPVFNQFFYLHIFRSLRELNSNWENLYLVLLHSAILILVNHITLFAVANFKKSEDYFT